MTNDEAMALITRHLAQYVGCEPSAILPSMHVIDDLAIESIDAVELLIGIERETDMRIEVDVLEEISTVQDLADRLSDASAAALLPKRGSRHRHRGARAPPAPQPVPLRRDPRSGCDPQAGPAGRHLGGARKFYQAPPR